MNMSESNRYCDRASDEANEWLDYLYSGDADEEGMQRFKDWMEVDPANAAAFRETEAVWRDLTLVNALANIDISAHLKPNKQNRVMSVLSALADVIRRPAFGAAAGFAATACVALILTANIYRAVPASVAPDYQTELAEIRDITLADGSIVTLGAKSEIKTDFSETERRVTLLAGEAFFSVAKDASRPFYVAADDTIVRVVGTKFDVRRGSERVRVSVLEGIVEVLRGDTVAKAEANSKSEQKRRLTAGQQIVAVRSKPITEVIAVMSDAPGAWREGRLVYANATLDEVIEDVNRYHDAEIRFGSPGLKNIRVTTAFGVDQIDSMLGVLEATQPLKVERIAANEIVLSADNDAK